MLRLLSNLVDVARLENGTLAVRPSELNLTRLLQSVIEQRRVLARARKIGIVLVPSPERTVVVDSDLLTRTVENILDNALRYTEEGGRIEIELKEMGDEFELRMGNTGPAIPLEARHTIFDKYGQAGAEVGRRNLGLGLYFCRLAVEAQGGRLWVEETETLPAVFGIRLPCRVTGTVRSPAPAALVA